MKAERQSPEILHTEKSCIFQNIEVIGLTYSRRTACALRLCGLTYKRCAQIMGCSADNVKNRIEDLYFKYRVNSTAQLMAKLIKEGSLKILVYVFAVHILIASPPATQNLRLVRNVRPPSNREMRV